MTAWWRRVQEHRASPYLPVLCAMLFGALLVSCNSDSKNLAPGNLPNPGATTARACNTPQTGCACEEEGKVIECGAINDRLGDYVTCTLGSRSCGGGQWSECQSRAISQPVRTNDKRYLALGQVSGCADNPCDPYCLNYVDDPGGLEDAGALGGLGGWMPGTGVGSGDGGLTLQPGSGGGGMNDGTCTGLKVMPATQDFVVTSYTPFTVVPPSAQFTAELTPAACASGAVTASWTLSSPEAAVITDTGVMTVYSPVSLKQTVRAYAGSFQAVGTANVTVDINDTSTAPAGTAAKFSDPPVGPDSAIVLYPYANTVFPRGIRAPTLQWDVGALGAADAVKVSLRYPATGAAKFSWSKVLPEGSPPRASIPQDVWAGFDQTASGDEALIILQRVIGGEPYDVIERPITFSTTPLRGRIYYTEYQRGADTVAGPSCWFPNNGTVIRSLDPGTTDSPINPFGNTNCGNVCHSVSAGGDVFVSAGKVATINPDGTFTQVANAPQPPIIGRDARGFAWAGITPDGKYVLQGSSIWGNTDEGDEQNTGASRLSTGNGNGLFAEYYNNPTLSGAPVLTRVDSKVDFTWLEGSPDPSIPADGFSVRWYGQVQPLETEDYTFETQSSDGVRLWVDGTLLVDAWLDQTAVWSGTISLIRGKKYDIIMEYYENTGEAQAVLRWSSPNTAYGAIPMLQLYAR